MDRAERSEDAAAVIPAINTASSTGAIRSLGTAAIDPIVVSEHPDPPGFRSKYCAEQVPVPDPNIDLTGYETALLTLSRRPEVKTVLPFREADIYTLARNRERFADHVGTPWPSLETLRHVQDRMELIDVARASGVSVPETRPFSEWDDWNQRCIVKPRYTVHAPEYADTFEEPSTQTGSTQYIPENERPDRATLCDTMGHEPIVQEYIPKKSEYGFFALYDGGTPVVTFQHRQVRGWKYAGGPSAYRESVRIPALETAGRSLLDALDWHGVAMVEFLRNPETDEFELMEVNPRFWSSLPFTIQSGVDFPYLYWLQAIEQPIFDIPEYETGIGGHLLSGEMLCLHSILTEEYPLVERPSFPGTLRDVCVSTIRQPRFDYLSRDDPGPFIRELRSLVGEMRHR